VNAGGQLTGVGRTRVAMNWPKKRDWLDRLDDEQTIRRTP